LYASPNIIRVIRWAGYAESIVKMRNAYKTLVGKPEGKRPLGRPRSKREDNIRMDNTKTGCGTVDWLHLTDSCEHGNEPSDYIKGGAFLN
jgi:hypothetical protein